MVNIIIYYTTIEFYRQRSSEIKTIYLKFLRISLDIRYLSLVKNALLAFSSVVRLSSLVKNRVLTFNVYILRFSYENSLCKWGVETFSFSKMQKEQNIWNIPKLDS